MYFIWLLGFFALLMLGCMAKENPEKMERELREFFFLSNSNERQKDGDVNDD